MKPIYILPYPMGSPMDDWHVFKIGTDFNSFEEYVAYSKREYCKDGLENCGLTEIEELMIGIGGEKNVTWESQRFLQKPRHVWEEYIKSQDFKGAPFLDVIYYKIDIKDFDKFLLTNDY